MDAQYAGATGLSGAAGWSPVERRAVGEALLGGAGSDDTLALAASDYADDGVLRDGHRSLPIDEPGKVTESWRELLRHRHLYAVSDFEQLKAKIMAAAKWFDIHLHDPWGAGLPPEGTPAELSCGLTHEGDWPPVAVRHL